MKNGKCHRHGGKNPSGFQNAMFKTGRKSKNLPTHLGEIYNEMLNNEDMLSLRSEVALIDTRLTEVIDELNTETGLVLWKKLKLMKSAYERHVRTRHQARAQEKLDEIFQIIETGADEFRKWNMILELIDHRRKTVESERKRLVENQEMMTAKEAMVMISAIHDVIKKNVDDPAVKRKIAHELAYLFDQPTASA